MDEEDVPSVYGVDSLLDERYEHDEEEERKAVARRKMLDQSDVDLLMCLGDDDEDDYPTAQPPPVAAKVPKPVSRAFESIGPVKSKPGQRPPARSVVPQNSKNEPKEKYSGLRLKSRFISSVIIQERFAGVNFLKMQRIRQADVTEAGAVWATIGVVATKMKPKQSSSGGIFTVWRLTDLQGTEISLFLFGTSYQDHWREPEGSVFGIKGAKIKKEDGSVSMSVDKTEQLWKIGSSLDMGQCKAEKRDGSPCTMYINKAECEYCSFHVDAAYKALASGRLELRGGNLVSSMKRKRDEALQRKIRDGAWKNANNGNPMKTKDPDAMREAANNSGLTHNGSASNGAKNIVYQANQIDLQQQKLGGNTAQPRRPISGLKDKMSKSSHNTPKELQNTGGSQYQQFQNKTGGHDLNTGFRIDVADDDDAFQRMDVMDKKKAMLTQQIKANGGLTDSEHAPKSRSQRPADQPGDSRPTRRPDQPEQPGDRSTNQAANPYLHRSADPTQAANPYLHRSAGPTQAANPYLHRSAGPTQANPHHHRSAGSTNCGPAPVRGVAGAAGRDSLLFGDVDAEVAASERKSRGQMALSSATSSANRRREAKPALDLRNMGAGAAAMEFDDKEAAEAKRKQILFGGKENPPSSSRRDKPLPSGERKSSKQAAHMAPSLPVGFAPPPRAEQKPKSSFLAKFGHVDTSKVDKQKAIRKSEADEDADDQTMVHLGHLEKRDQLAEKAAEQMEYELKVWHCSSCDIYAPKRLDMCIELEHDVEKKKAMKRKFKCGHCKLFNFSWNRRGGPKQACSKCQSTNWKQVPLTHVKEFHHEDLAERGNVKARGTEHGFSLR